jgi:hypothetical protein
MFKGLDTWWAGTPGSAWSDVTSVLGFVLTVVALVWAWWHTCCKVFWCVRPGKHQVKSTTWKVCPNHHTHAHHARLAKKHADEHPDRLGHGESWHTAGEAEAAADTDQA